MEVPKLEPCVQPVMLRLKFHTVEEPKGHCVAAQIARPETKNSHS
jgi:hypothetical protein